MRLSIALIALLLVAGCASLPLPGSKAVPGGASAPGSPTLDLIQAAQLAGYAQALATVVNGSPAEQAEVMASARAGYDQAKLGPAALRYGLLLAAPGHPARNITLAQRVLHEALSRADLLHSGERALGTVELARVEAELRQTAEVNRLVAELQQEREKQRTAAANPALNKRLQSEIEESTRLRKQLDEARAKLEAITRMERSNSDRPAQKEEPR